MTQEQLLLLLSCAGILRGIISNHRQELRSNDMERDMFDAFTLPADKREAAKVARQVELQQAEEGLRHFDELLATVSKQAAEET